MGHHQDAIKSLDYAEKFYSAIGRFIESFSQMEDALKFVIADAVDLNKDQSSSDNVARLRYALHNCSKNTLIKNERVRCKGIERPYR